MNENRYTKRLDAYQHLVIMLFAQLGQFDSLREVELGFLCAASSMNHFGIDYMGYHAHFDICTYMALTAIIKSSP